MNYKLLVIFSIVFLILDITWISFFSRYFNPMIEAIQKKPVKINMIGAVLAYLVMLYAYYNLAYDGDVPNYQKAALLGLAIYGTYEFTNLATITVSVLSLFITDMIYRYMK